MKPFFDPIVEKWAVTVGPDIVLHFGSRWRARAFARRLEARNRAPL